MQLAAGTHLGRYQIRSLLGAGGMGEVYLAHDTTLGRGVAVKVLPADAARDRDRLQRFEQEAHAASSLNHPNILTIHEVGVHEGTPFVATELVDGESLRERLSRGRLEVRDVLDVGVQLASALAAAHAAGIVHRDIKPENIMIRKDGIVKVLDFGLAKLAAVRAEDGNAATIAAVETLPGVVLGTVQYMSPEQARGLETDARTDIWSLGVVLYELLAGRFTFEGRTSSDLIAAILRTDPPPLTTYVPDAPPELVRIVTKALQKDREDRYQDARDLAVDLKSLKRHLEFDTQLSRQSGGHPDLHLERRAGRGRTGAAIVGTAAVAALALGYAAYSGRLGIIGRNTIDSVAVLPFTNESGDPENEYLSDGITDSLINSLSQVSGLKVIARSSSFRYKGKAVDPRDAARAMGVGAIVTGRLTQRGGELLIGAELTDARDERHVWGDQYRRKATDLQAVQAEISSDIAEQLRRRLTTSERERLTKEETANQQAYELLLKGRFYFQMGGSQNRKKAIEHFRQAIALDPTYANAYAHLAFTYRNLVVDSVLDPREYTPKAEAAVRKALELNDSLAQAHFVLGSLKRDAWDWLAAEHEYERAITLNPNSAGAHGTYASFLTVVGRHDQAIAEAKRFKELDPLSSDPFAYRLFFARRYDEAMEAAKRSLDEDRDRIAGHVVLGYICSATGKHAEAIRAFQEAIRLGDESPSTQIFLGAAYAGDGDRARAQAILERLQTSASYVSPGELAVLYAALGRREEAFASLERGFTIHDAQMQFLKVDPAFDTLRDDPRFADLMRRVGLPASPSLSAQ